MRKLFVGVLLLSIIVGVLGVIRTQTSYAAGAAVRTAKSISVGDSHTCAILDDNSVKCWGNNDAGQLGYDDTNNRGRNAGDMATLETVNLGMNLGAIRTAKSIAVGVAASSGEAVRRFES